MLIIDWEKIQDYSEEEITYFLYSEGKSIQTLARIRRLDEATIKKHVLEGKIKYGILAKSSNIKELFTILSSSGKQDKIDTINYLDKITKDKLVKFIKENYADMYPREKQSAVWILGEIGYIEGIDILLKASVHKFINIRRMAVSAMGKIGDKKCEEALIRALEDDNPQVVFYAIKSLYKIKSSKAKLKIIRLKDNANKDYIKNAAEEYLSETDSDTSKG